MIEDLRFVVRYVPADEVGSDIVRPMMILQAYDGHSWFDVQIVTDTPKNTEEE